MLDIQNRRAVTSKTTSSPSSTWASPKSAATYKLKFSGLVIAGRVYAGGSTGHGSIELAAGYECSGTVPSYEGLSQGRFTGVRLSDVLKHVESPKAREVVFGTDRGPQEVVFRTNIFKVEQQFGRSVTLENAMKREPMLAYALNGEP